MATNYNSTHTGAQTDAYDARITALETALATLQTNLTSIQSQANTNTTNISSIQTNYATKAQVNSVITTYSSTVSATSLTLTNSAKKTAWTDAISSWTAPSNGVLVAYFAETSGTPAAVISDINKTGYAERRSVNGTREFTIMMPVVSGRSYKISYIYCAVHSAYFFPAMTI